MVEAQVGALENIVIRQDNVVVEVLGYAKGKLKGVLRCKVVGHNLRSSMAAVGLPDEPLALGRRILVEDIAVMEKRVGGLDKGSWHIVHMSSIVGIEKAESYGGAMIDGITLDELAGVDQGSDQEEIEKIAAAAPSVEEGLEGVFGTDPADTASVELDAAGLPKNLSTEELLGEATSDPADPPPALPPAD